MNGFPTDGCILEMPPSEAPGRGVSEDASASWSAAAMCRFAIYAQKTVLTLLAPKPNRQPPSLRYGGPRRAGALQKLRHVVAPPRGRCANAPSRTLRPVPCSPKHRSRSTLPARIQLPLAWLLLAGWLGPAPAASPDPKVAASIERYCTRCHDADTKKGGLDLDRLRQTDVTQHADDWERVQ